MLLKCNLTKLTIKSSWYFQSAVFVCMLSAVGTASSDNILMKHSQSDLHQLTNSLTICSFSSFLP